MVNTHNVVGTLCIWVYTNKKNHTLSEATLAVVKRATPDPTGTAYWSWDVDFLRKARSVSAKKMRETLNSIKADLLKTFYPPILSEVGDRQWVENNLWGVVLKDDQLVVGRVNLANQIDLYPPNNYPLLSNIFPDQTFIM